MKHLTSWPLNELVKLTMIWTTDPRLSSAWSFWHKPIYVVCWLVLICSINFILFHMRVRNGVFAIWITFLGCIFSYFKHSIRIVLISRIWYFKFKALCPAFYYLYLQMINNYDNYHKNKVFNGHSTYKRHVYITLIFLTLLYCMNFYSNVIQTSR